MEKKYNKTLIMFTLILFITGVCFFFSKNFKSDFMAGVAYGATLENSQAVTPSGSKISSDTAFLNTLGVLDRIKIDTGFFTSKSFLSLKDNSVDINGAPVKAGRANPFIELESMDIHNMAANIKRVTTGEASLITDKAVVLNGYINGVEGVTDVYFEYGKTNTLGTVVADMEPSLIGAFIKNILGLTPKTNYFYKACAKINNVANCGEIVSFSTK